MRPNQSSCPTPASGRPCAGHKVAPSLVRITSTLARAEMLFSLRKMFGGAAPSQQEGTLAQPREGNRREAVRIAISSGVWVPYREQIVHPDGATELKFFDLRGYFPVFSLAERIVPYLQRRGVIDATKLTTVPALQLTALWFASNPQLCDTVVFDPGFESQWVFDKEDFATIARTASNEG